MSKKDEMEFINSKIHDVAGAFNGHYENLRAEYNKKNLPINLQELVDNKYFLTGFAELLKYQNIKQIKLDGKLGKKIGFTSDKFAYRSLLCLLNNTVMVLFVECQKERCGYFTGLIDNILARGLDFEILSPFESMVEWAEKNKESLDLKFYKKNMQEDTIDIISNKEC